MSGKPNSEVRAMDVALGALSGLETDEQRRVLAWLGDKLKLSGSTPLGTSSPATPAIQLSGGAPAGDTGAAGISPKQFMALKKPKTDAERITCLAYFMTHSRKAAQFKTKELTDLNKEAAGVPFSDPRVAVNNAALSHYLTAAGGGAKQITVRGEALVEALPDREKVKAAMEENPARHRRPSKIKRRKSS